MNTNNQPVNSEKRSDQKTSPFKLGKWNLLRKLFSGSDLSFADWERIESKPKRANCSERFF